LLGAIVLSVVVFGGSVGPSAPHYSLTLVAPRAPGYASPSLPLATADGRAVLFQDLLPVLGVLAALAAVAFRMRHRVTSGLLVFYATLAAASIVALTCLDFEGKAPESHRFTTALFVSTPILAALALQHRARTGSLGVAVGGIAALTMYVTLGLGVASTAEWLLSGVAYRQCLDHGFYGWSSDRFFEVDCRQETGAKLGERTTQTYVDLQGFYLWAGCHPVFAPAAPVGPGGHKIKVGGPWYGRPAAEQLRQRLPSPGDLLDVVCLTAVAAGPNPDPACERARTLGSCQTRGEDFRSCSLDGPARAALAGKP
jgi:hypothetical protein